MKAIIGLGNPGTRYDNTRHNVGFILVEKIAKEKELQFKESKKCNSLIAMKDKTLLLAEPQTFMNNSGKAVKAILGNYYLKADDLYIVHDDLDIVLGEYKIQREKGPKVHNGISSIEEEIGKKDFWRIRVGVDNRDSQNRTPGEVYVLDQFSEEESIILENVLNKILLEIEKLI